ncbi:immunity repressor [Gordonia phage ObLaDi]|uniref:Immunity repressor n=1 Tax=Gordonia phage ObLaDi TaxID=2978487 RepID=A0A977KMP9_9CAUD|nr:immunity repressor [Gordonia phage ObLaDi]
MPKTYIRPTTTIEAYATYRLGRKVTVEEAATSLGLSRTQYWNRRSEEKIGADHVLRAAHYFGLNPVQALVEMGCIPLATLRECVAAWDAEWDAED